MAVLAPTRPARAQTVPPPVPPLPTDASFQFPLNATTTQTHKHKTTFQANVDAWNAAAPADQSAVTKVMNESTTNPTQAKGDFAKLTSTQQALTKPTSEKTKLVIKPVPPPPGQAATLGQACYNLWINDHISWWFVTEASVHFEVDDVCIVYNLFGYWVILNTPGAWATHYNNVVFFLWCGYEGWFQDWIQGATNLAWGASATADFLYTPFYQAQCNNFAEKQDHMGIWIYAGEQGPFNPPIVLNTSEDWSGIP